MCWLAMVSATQDAKDNREMNKQDVKKLFLDNPYWSLPTQGSLHSGIKKSSVNMKITHAFWGRVCVVGA